MRFEFVLAVASMCVVFAAAAEIQADESSLPDDPKALIYGVAATTHPVKPVSLSDGPLLFLDERYIASGENVRRVVTGPQRDPSIPNPIITGKGDACFQPYLTVLRDPDTQQFRLWYGRHTDTMEGNRSHIGYAESADGVHWENIRALPDPSPIQFGVAVVDTYGTPAYLADRRYVYGWHYEGWFSLAGSTDGLAWKPLDPSQVMKHSHDISGLYYDPARKRFVATLSVYRPGYDWNNKRRVTLHSFSTDLKTWTAPHYVALPVSGVDEGDTQFYAVDGYLARGSMLIGMVKVLRDDLKADDPPTPADAYGIGYTALTWSYDGEHWLRDTAHFLDRDTNKDAWDHSHAWIDEQLPVVDEVYLYYGGYAHGHKVNRFEERQIGLLRIAKDRYVAREATSGTLTTVPVLVDGALTVNADASKGRIRVQALDENGVPIPGCTFDECSPVTGNGVDLPVRWNGAIIFGIRPVRLEFQLENARLFAIGV